MVALNFQTPDVGMQLNQGKFDYSGYHLKPEHLRRPDTSDDPPSPPSNAGDIHYTVRVLSGSFLAERRVDTCVEVEMYAARRDGPPTDSDRRWHRTKTVLNNGLNPRYPGDPFDLGVVEVPELAMLRLSVRHDVSGRLLGQRVLPLDGLRPGYRHITLLSESGHPLAMPSLFVHLAMKSCAAVKRGRWEGSPPTPGPLTLRRRSTKQESTDVDDADVVGGSS
jgi:phosphatidylinositol phospholipase C, beta